MIQVYGEPGTSHILTGKYMNESSTPVEFIVILMVYMYLS